MRCPRDFGMLPTLLLLIVVAACAPGKGFAPDVPRQSYIDANLHFTVSYPESWGTSLSPAGVAPYPSHSVVWDIPPAGPRKGLSVIVVSLPRHDIVPRTAPLETLRDIYPNLTLVGRTDETLPAGDAERLDGFTPHDTVRAWSVAGEASSYLLVFTASPEDFSALAERFREIAESFAILE